MGNNEIAIRFTEEKYATKSEVAKELKITTIDTFWDNILAYRSQFNRYLSIKSIDRNLLVFCGCQSVNSFLYNVENKLIKINRSYSKLYSNPTQLKLFCDRSKVKILKLVADKYSLNISEEFLYSYFAGETTSLSNEYEIISKYSRLIDYIAEANVNPINGDYLAEIFSRIKEITEITSYYRNNDDDSNANKVLLGRVYTCAPAAQIDSMMDSLFDFISRSNISILVKTILVYFYFTYVHPFDEYSDELAMLFAKSVLAHESLGELAAYLPFEELFLKNDDISRIMAEVQKTNDTTYFVNYVLNFVSTKADEIQDFICNLNVQEIKNDFYKEEVKKEVETEQNIIEQVKETPVITPKEVERNETIPTPKENVTYVKEELAVNFIPVALDEKQAALLEQDLMERDPSLKRGEAHFYARHCSKGRKYTIAQYKKCMRCAYETARTSMDHLAALHYYQKEKFKNKFVYCPVVR